VKHRLLPITSAANNTDNSKITVEKIDMPIAPGPCEPTWKSLGDHFQRPTWWRKAKIGMWLFWGPMSVGEEGDWHAEWLSPWFDNAWFLKNISVADITAAHAGFSPVRPDV